MRQISEEDYTKLVDALSLQRAGLGRLSSDISEVMDSLQIAQQGTGALAAVMDGIQAMVAGWPIYEPPTEEPPPPVAPPTPTPEDIQIVVVDGTVTIALTSPTATMARFDVDPGVTIEEQGLTHYRDLSPGEYFAQVAAGNAVGWSEQSVQVPFTMPPVTPPPDPDPPTRQRFTTHQRIVGPGRSNFEVIRNIDWNAIRQSLINRGVDPAHNIPEDVAWAVVFDGEGELRNFLVDSNTGGIGSFGGNDKLKLREFEIRNCGGPQWMTGGGLYHVYPQRELDMEDGVIGQIGAGLKNHNPIHNHAGQSSGRMTLLRMRNILYRNGGDILIDEFDRWEMDNVDTDAYSIDVGYQDSDGVTNGLFIAKDLRAPQLKFRLPVREIHLTGIQRIQHFNWAGGVGFDPLARASWHFAEEVTIDGTRIK